MENESRVHQIEFWFERIHCDVGIAKLEICKILVLRLTSSYFELRLVDFSCNHISRRTDDLRQFASNVTAAARNFETPHPARQTGTFQCRVELLGPNGSLKMWSAANVARPI